MKIIGCLLTSIVLCIVLGCSGCSGGSFKVEGQGSSESAAKEDARSKLFHDYSNWDEVKEEYTSKSEAPKQVGKDYGAYGNEGVPANTHIYLLPNSFNCET